MSFMRIQDAAKSSSSQLRCPHMRVNHSDQALCPKVLAVGASDPLAPLGEQREGISVLTQV